MDAKMEVLKKRQKRTSAASASEQQEAKSTFPHYRAPAFPSMLLSRVPFPHLRAGEQWARVAQVTIMSTALN